MAQQIEFAAIPNTQPIAYPTTIALILGEVHRSNPTPKAFREFLRMRNLFDKAGFAALMALLDVQVGAEKVGLGPFARRLFETDDEPAVRKLLAERLVSENPLLAKYCIEAMDTDHGGRLHSTNELYRMVTSYVYPGKKPTLPSFRAWVDWAVASQLFKLVGIRWAIGEVGREFLPRLRAMDVDEFLEEEAAGAAGGEPEAPEAEGPETAEEPAEETVQVPAEPTAQPEPKPEVPVARETPVEPAPMSAVRPAEEPAATREAPRPARARVAPVRVVVPPSAERGWFRPAPITAEALDQLRDALIAWHEGYPGRRPAGLAAVGLEVGTKAPIFWHEAAFAALLCARGLPAETVRVILQAFREATVLPAVARGKVPLDALRALMGKFPGPEVVSACEMVIHLPRVFEALDDLTATLSSEDAREVLWGLWRRLYEPVAPLAPFLFARFLWEGGRLRKAAFEAAFIPWFRVRENAFRLGFLDRMYAEGFADLIEAAVTLATRFGEPSFEAPLAEVHEAFGCAFRCARAATCALPACREKAEVAQGG